MIMKNNWQIKKLGEVVQIQNGFAFKSSDYVGSGFFVMRITNVQDGIIELNNPKYINQSIGSFGNFILKENDILMSLTGNVGRVGIIKKNHLPAVLNQRVARLNISDQIVLDRDFLFYFLRSPKFYDEIVRKGKGIAQQNVSTKDIENLEIPLPPLETQKEIVAKLDEKFVKLREAKKLREEALVNTEKIFSQTLSETFEGGRQKGWKEDSLNNVAEKVADGTHDTPEYFTHGYPLITSKNLLDTGLDFSNIKYISEEDYIKINQRSGVKRGDLLIAMIGTIGNITRIETDEKFSIKNVGLIKPDESKVLGKYIMYFLHNSRLSSLIQSKGATQKFIALGPIRNIKIQFPLISEQQTIVFKLDQLLEKIKTLRGLQNSQLEYLKILEKAYLREAFDGEFGSIFLP